MKSLVYTEQKTGSFCLSCACMQVLLNSSIEVRPEYLGYRANSRSRAGHTACLLSHTANQMNIGCCVMHSTIIIVTIACSSSLVVEPVGVDYVGHLSEFCFTPLIEASFNMQKLTCKGLVELKGHFLGGLPRLQ